RHRRSRTARGRSRGDDVERRIRWHPPQAASGAGVSTFQIVPVGDAVLVVEFEERIDPAVNARAVATADVLRSASIAGVRHVVPTYRSVAVYFDPLLTDHSGLIRRLEEAAAEPPRADSRDRALIRVPVCYGGDFGPDLKDIAGFAHATEADVVEIHTS